MNRNVELYKALSDETRLRILALLLAEGELCVCDIIAALHLPQSTISRHLGNLRSARWVNDRRCGLWIYYSINDGDLSIREMIPLLKKQLLDTQTAVADRELLASFGKNNCCA